MPTASDVSPCDAASGLTAFARQQRETGNCVSSRCDIDDTMLAQGLTRRRTSLISGKLSTLCAHFSRYTGFHDTALILTYCSLASRSSFSDNIHALQPSATRQPFSNGESSPNLRLRLTIPVSVLPFTALAPVRAVASLLTRLTMILAIKALLFVGNVLGLDLLSDLYVLLAFRVRLESHAVLVIWHSVLHTLKGRNRFFEHFLVSTFLSFTTIR